MKETQMKADALLSESESQARSVLEQAENNARIILDDLQSEVKKIEESYHQLKQQRDSLLRELKNMADGFLDQVSKAKGDQDKYSIDDLVKKTKKLTKISYSFEASPEKNTDPIQSKPATSDLSVGKRTDAAKSIPKAEPSNDEGSFFDTLD